MPETRANPSLPRRLERPFFRSQSRILGLGLWSARPSLVPTIRKEGLRINLSGV